jgi:hypothetical protein
MKSTAAKLSALIAVSDWGCGAGLRWSLALPPRHLRRVVRRAAHLTDVSDYTEGTMILAVPLVW